MLSWKNRKRSSLELKNMLWRNESFICEKFLKKNIVMESAREQTLWHSPVFMYRPEQRKYAIKEKQFWQGTELKAVPCLSLKNLRDILVLCPTAQQRWLLHNQE